MAGRVKPVRPDTWSGRLDGPKKATTVRQWDELQVGDARFVQVPPTAFGANIDV